MLHNGADDAGELAAFLLRLQVVNGENLLSFVQVFASRLSVVVAARWKPATLYMRKRGFGLLDVTISEHGRARQFNVEHFSTLFLQDAQGSLPRGAHFRVKRRAERFLWHAELDPLQ